MVSKVISELFSVSAYLVRTAHKIKKIGGILAKPAPKKGRLLAFIS